MVSQTATSRAERYDHLLSDRGLALLSKDPADHPNADQQTCQIHRDHGAHPYGAIHPDGGLRHWCGGRPEPETWGGLVESKSNCAYCATGPLGLPCALHRDAS